MIGPFVDVGWLRAHRDDVVLADVRFYLDGRSGRAAYGAAHIPGAVYIELAEVLSGPPSPTAGRHPLPRPERFAAGLTAAGIGDGDLVVGYDDAGGVIAARLVWMLRAIGHDAALLEGGIDAWPGRCDSGSGPPPPPADPPFSPRPWPRDRLADIDEVAHRPPGTVLIDARDRDRFAGVAPDPIDPRSGHIPGALNIPAREPASFAELAGSDVISYCGSGVTACFNLLRLERAGLGPGRLFPGSWSQWSADARRPVASGDGDR